MPISKNKFSYTLDLSDKMDGIKPSERKTASDAVGVFLLSEILTHLDGENSPVAGNGRFKGLSKNYKEKKKAEGKGDKANLQLFNDMVNDIDVRSTKTDVTLKITDSLQKKKAFNHNTGDSKGMPKRQFFPDDSSDEKFKSSIMSGVDQVLGTFKTDTKKTAASFFTDDERERIEEILPLVDFERLE